MHGGGASGARGRAGDAPVRSVSGGWENLMKGDGVWRAGGGTGGSGASRRSRRRRFKPSTAAALQVEHGGGHGEVTGFLAREFLEISHGDVTSKVSCIHS